MWRAILLLLAYWLFELTAHEASVHMTKALQQQYKTLVVQCVHAHYPIKCLACRRVNTAGDGSARAALAARHFCCRRVREKSLS